MGTSIADRYNPSKQLKVNDDGSIDINNSAVETNQTDGSQKTQVVDSDGNNVDFATASNQVSLNTIQTNIEILTEEIKELIDCLYELTARIAGLASAKGTAADIRVTNLNTPNMTTLTTLTNLTNVGSYPGNLLQQSAENSSAVLGNINNVQG